LLAEHLRAGGSYNAWTATHRADRDSRLYSFAEIMQRLAHLNSPCPTCGASSWRWEGAGQLYKCGVYHP